MKSFASAPVNVEALMVLQARERRKPGGDGVVRARLDSHIIRRVGVDQIDRRAFHQALHIFATRRISAQQAVIAQDPQIAAASDRLLERLGNSIFLDKAFVRRLGILRKPRGDLLIGKPKHVQVELVLSQIDEQPAQQLFIPSRACNGELVVGDDQRPPLRLAQVIEHDHRHFAQAELARGHDARMTRDDHAVRANQDWIRPAELHDRGCNLRDLLLGMRTRIPGEGNQPVEGPAFDLDICLHFLM
jgi:hypothetical protein